MRPALSQPDDQAHRFVTRFRYRSPNRARVPLQRYVSRMRSEKVWIEQCRATVAIRRHFGAESALDYLIGEKLMMYADAAGLTSGGIGAMHRLAQSTGLVTAIDQHVQVLKVHLAYHESDHVLGIAYNVLCGGTCLQDIEQRRQDEVYLDALGTHRIPVPTTGGDTASTTMRSMRRTPVRATFIARH
jgi:hypothetical protein